MPPCATVAYSPFRFLAHHVASRFPVWPNAAAALSVLNHLCARGLLRSRRGCDAPGASGYLELEGKGCAHVADFRRFEEIQISVPGGELAALCWPAAQPGAPVVVAAHGI